MLKCQSNHIQTKKINTIEGQTQNNRDVTSGTPEN